ncbi:nucleotidyl transferase AbiEii/AbiGii toxin family protein [Vitreimonas flagellata]|uniref:nucleotidyl transferase AbiEii/AbiGii toxin family protein n=1 Tax=Vitreimonas flagellata TaxID=2560861 RepID=UPI0010758241|nr:nucleotidyl transferase AbiEii/AbiGii toxin family protein [Vitreimonas flagellata]
MRLLHEEPDFADLLAVTGRSLGTDPSLVEKDYWIMHALWGLQQLGRRFELKGGTSLSKGYGIIDRFSEDIDIRIEPPADLPVGANHDKEHHAEARRAFYDGLAQSIVISGFGKVERDTAFDDTRYRSGGVRLLYQSAFPLPAGIKQGVLLEAGFDQVAPNRPRDISSWAYDAASRAGVTDIIDNRALGVPCYEPGYTLVEKLQTISTKHRQHQATGKMPQNFMRHYYDVYCLLADRDVQSFIGTALYVAHKAKRFPAADNQDIAANDAFVLSDTSIRSAYEAAYVSTSALYFRGQPTFGELLERIHRDAPRL